MIWIDNRKGSKELLSKIPLPATKKQLKRMEFGDVAFTGNGPNGPCLVGIERKTVGDLLKSIDSGRLSGHQLPGLLNSFDKVYILVEGIWRTDPKTGIMETYKYRGWKPVQFGQRKFMGKEVHNYLTTLSVMCGVVAHRTESIIQSGMWISDLFGWWDKPWEKHKGLKQFTFELPPVAYIKKPTLAHRIIKELEGVGWERGKLISQQYPTIHSMMAASREDFASIKGVGKKLADTIYNQLHEEE